MNLTSEQQTQYNRLSNYLKALENTQQANLALHETPSNTNEQTNTIWQANFVLQYMIVSYQEYLTLLDLLRDNNMAVTLLNLIYASLSNKLAQKDNAIDPLDAFEAIRDVIKDNDFKVELRKLADAYQQKNDKNLFLYKSILAIGIVGAIGFIGFIALASCGVYVLAAMPITILMLCAAPVIASMYLRFMITPNYSLSSLLFDEHKKTDPINDCVNRLKSCESSKFSFDKTHTYVVKDSQGKNELTQKRSNNPTSGTELKNRFFNSDLKEQVRTEYNSIPVAITN